MYIPLEQTDKLTFIMWGDKLSQLYIDPPILGETLRLIRRYEMIFGNSEKQNLLEDLPVSLTYEIAGCSRISRRQKLGERIVQSVKMQSEVKVNDT